MDTALLKGLQTSIPGRYARALFEVAAEQNNIDLIRSHLKQFEATCRIDPKTKQGISFIDEDAFIDLINPVISEKKWPAYFVHFLQILHKHQRLSILKQIVDVFNKCCDHANGVLNVQISTPVMPTTSQRKKIQDRVAAIFGKKIAYQYESIPDLLGGVVIQADNLLIDASLKKQFTTLEKDLKEIPLKGAA